MAIIKCPKTGLTPRPLAVLMFYAAFAFIPLYATDFFDPGVRAIDDSTGDSKKRRSADRMHFSGEAPGADTDSDGDGLRDGLDIAPNMPSNVCGATARLEDIVVSGGSVIQCRAAFPVTVKPTTRINSGARVEIHSSATELSPGFSVPLGAELAITNTPLPPTATLCDDGGAGQNVRTTLTALESVDFSILPAFPDLRLPQAIALTVAPGDRSHLYVASLDGFVRRFEAREDITSEEAEIFLDLSDRTRASGEQGLLGLAFDPDYQRNGFVYVYYSANLNTGNQPGDSVIARFTADPDLGVAEPMSEVQLLRFAQPFRNHNAGALAFGPDGMLYISSGDGGSANDPNNNAQNLQNLLGKILRIAPGGAIPADNPFANTPGVRGEIWAYGLRNPFRFSFDKTTGKLWAGDVGQRAQEEIDIIRGCGNYGWRVYEGTQSNINPEELPFDSFDPPVFTYPRSQGRSVSGGVVYRGNRIPQLTGRYLYGDFVSNRIWALTASDTMATDNVEIGSAPNPSSFGTGLDGEPIITSFSGQLFRLVPGLVAGDIPPRLSETGLFDDVASLTPAPDLIEYRPNANFWSDAAEKRRWFRLPPDTVIGFADDGAWDFPLGTTTVKHFEIDLADGSRMRLETRVFELQENGWRGYTYRWNAQETDAELLPGGATVSLETQDSMGNPRSQTYRFPDRAECLQCHNSSAGIVLGIRTNQLNAPLVAGGSGNQLTALNNAGLFDQDIGDPAAYDSLANPENSNDELAARARAYLETNCAQCHRPNGPTPVNMDLRAATPIANTNTIDVSPSGTSAGVSNARRIAPGEKERSLIWVRMNRLSEAERMPPVGSHRIDEGGLQLIGEWIDLGAQ